MPSRFAALLGNNLDNGSSSIEEESLSDSDSDSLSESRRSRTEKSISVLENKPQSSQDSAFQSSADYMEFGQMPQKNFDEPMSE